MSPSILILDTYYPGVIKSLGFDGIGAGLSAHDEQLRQLVNAGFGTGEAYRRNFERLGWNARILVPNARGIQMKWAEENVAPKPIPIGWDYGLHLARLPVVRSQLHRFPHMHNVLLNQVKKIRPDIIYVQDLNLIPAPFGRELKKLTKLFVGEIASPLPPKSYFSEYDLIVSALPTIVNQAQSWGVDALSLPLGFDETRATFSAASTRPIDAIFIGSFSRHQPNTFPLLQEVAGHVPGLRIYGPGGDKLFRTFGLQNFYYGEVWGDNMFKLLGNSKVVVNRHGTIAGDFAVNMRMYEATGSGAVLVTEHKSNIAELFIPGQEILTYHSQHEAGKIVANVLKNPKKLDSIASGGQQKTLAVHTYKQRINVLSEALRSRL